MTTITPAEFATKVGEKIGTSEWILVDQDMINKFADATGDHQFIHINEEMAKMTPFVRASGYADISSFLNSLKSALANGSRRLSSPLRLRVKTNQHFRLNGSASFSYNF
jgi:acyl dehydratase